MFRFLEILFPGKNRFNEELNQLNQEIEPLKEALITWKYEDLELLSLIQKERDVSSYKGTTEGIILSIYHEDMAAYKWKQLRGFGDIQVCVIATKQYNFKYIIKNGGASMYINDRFLGEFKKDHFVYTGKRNRIAYVDMNGADWWEVFLQDKKLGSLANIQKARDVNPRAYFMGGELSEGEQAVFMCITLYLIVFLTKDEKRLRFR